MVFMVFQKVFSTLHNYSLYICFFEITNYAETLLKIPFSVNGQFSIVLTSHWLEGKCARINLSQADFVYVNVAYLRIVERID